jgi:hypothetical protein
MMLALFRVPIVAFIALTLMTNVGLAPAVAAQQGLPCTVDRAPNDEFASAGFGLVRQELDALYGAGEATQTGYYYAFDGFDLILTDCDLVLTITPGSAFEDAETVTALVETLLPEDAVLAGSWQFGVLDSQPQDGEEWISAELAARYRLLGAPRTGAILVLYTYEGNAFQPGAITRVEMRSAAIPSAG